MSARTGHALTVAILACRVSFLALLLAPLAITLLKANQSLFSAVYARHWTGLTIGQFLLDPLAVVQTPLFLIGAILFSVVALVVAMSFYLAIDFRLQRFADIASMRDPRDTNAMLAAPFSLYLREFQRDNEILKGGESEYLAPEPPSDGFFIGLLYTLLVLPVYLVAFYTRRMRLWSLEELIANKVSPGLGFLAIGRPGEKLPAAGATKFYVSDNDWQQVVVDLVAHAEVVFLRVGSTKGLAWEIARVLTPQPQVPVVLLMVNESGKPMPSRVAIELLGAAASHALRAELAKFLYVRTSTVLPDGKVRVTGHTMSQWLDGSGKYFGWQSVIDHDVGEALALSRARRDWTRSSRDGTGIAGLARYLRSWWLALAAAALVTALLWPSQQHWSNRVIDLAWPG